MIDCFALLDEPRRPWIDTGILKEKFLARSAAAHPDRFHTSDSVRQKEASDRYSEFNAAHNRLRDSKERLAHLLELELGRRPETVQTAPADATESFFQVGQICREADQFIARRAQSASPLLKAQSFAEGLALADRITELRQTLERQQETIEAALKPLNDAWNSAPPVDSPGRIESLPLARLEELYRSLGYLGRWRAQLQDRFVQLSL